jgi:hypothetical protein
LTTTGSFIDVFTCPAGRTAIMHGLVMFNAGTGSTGFALATPTSGAESLCFGAPAVSSFSFTFVPFPIIINPEETLYAISTTEQYIVTGFGSLLLGEPE